MVGLVKFLQRREGIRHYFRLYNKFSRSGTCGWPRVVVAVVAERSDHLAGLKAISFSYRWPSSWNLTRLLVWFGCWSSVVPVPSEYRSVSSTSKSAPIMHRTSITRKAMIHRTTVTQASIRLRLKLVDGRNTVLSSRLKRFMSSVHGRPVLLRFFLIWPQKRDRRLVRMPA